MKRFWDWNLRWTPVYHFSKGNYRKGFLVWAINIAVAFVAFAAAKQASAAKQGRDWA